MNNVKYTLCYLETSFFKSMSKKGSAVQEFFGASSEVSDVALRMSRTVIEYMSVKERGIKRQRMFYLLLTW